MTKNPTAFFVPCTAHSWNLLLGDMASVVPMAITFFGTIQRLYTLFSGSGQRWHILMKHLTNLTLKPLSDTRWECRVNAVKPIRFDLDKIKELNEVTEDSQIKSESNSLLEHGINFEFVLSTVIWYDLLSKVNTK